MRVIVGLGNPGKQYENTSHNIGFLVLNTLVNNHPQFSQHVGGIKAWKPQFQSEFTKMVVGEHQALLLKPQTFMNLSGMAVASCLRFFKIPLEDLLVVSDDLDLPLGTLRYRLKGSAGGHRGLQNIIERCGGQGFARLRIGIGRPPEKIQVKDYVLGRLNKQALQKLEPALEDAQQRVVEFINKKI